MDIDLIGGFAPDYDALGKTLGEKLPEGFQSKVGDVVSWFQQRGGSLYAIQEEADLGMARLRFGLAA